VRERPVVKAVPVEHAGKVARLRANALWRGRAEVGAIEQLICPHLDALYNLAVWLTLSERDAEDLIEGACLRAVIYFNEFQGANHRLWLLASVRGACCAWLGETNAKDMTFDWDDEEAFSSAAQFDGTDAESNSDLEEPVLERAGSLDLKRATRMLPWWYREILILHEIEKLPYREISTVTNLPVSVVASRLALARSALAKSLFRDLKDSLLPQVESSTRSHRSPTRRDHVARLLEQPSPEGLDLLFPETAGRANEEEGERIGKAEVERSDQAALGEVSGN